MPARIDGDSQLGADAVGRGDKHRILESCGFQVEKTAETAEFAIRAGTDCRPGQRFDSIDERVAGIDIDACITIAEAICGRFWPVNRGLLTCYDALTCINDGTMFDKQRNMASQPTVFKIPTGVLTALALGLLLAAAMLPRTGHAQAIFAVSGVPIDESAENEVDAKETGLRKAKVAAFQQLMNRLVVQQDQARIPSVDWSTVEGLISDFSLSDEKFGGGRYLASLNVRFQPIGVRRLLESNNLTYSETMSSRLVVLPVFENGGVAQLWDETNQWLSAWVSLSDLDAPPVPLAIPLGDIADVSAISAAQAARLIPENIAAVAGRYQAAGAVVAIARLGSDPATGGYQVDVAYVSTAPGWSDVTSSFSITGKAEEPLEDVLIAAATATTDSLVESWKNQNAIQPNQATQRLAVVVPLSGLPSWVAVQKRLAKISPVKAIDLTEIALDRAAIDIVFVGTIDQLQRSLNQNGLGLINNLETGEVQLVASRP